MYPQHEHISRVSFLVCLSVFACTPVHSNSLTTSTDSLACIAGALTKQLSVLPLSKHVSHTCLTSSSNTRVFHTKMGGKPEHHVEACWSLSSNHARRSCYHLVREIRFAGYCHFQGERIQKTTVIATSSTALETFVDDLIFARALNQIKGTRE